MQVGHILYPPRESPTVAPRSRRRVEKANCIAEGSEYLTLKGHLLTDAEDPHSAYDGMLLQGSKMGYS